MKGSAEGGGEAVVGWGVEAEEVDALGWLSADDTTTGGNGKTEERWNWWHFMIDSVSRQMFSGMVVEKVTVIYGASLRSYLEYL